MLKFLLSKNMSSKAYTYIIKILSARDYSEYKLREKLREKNFPPVEIDDALSEIKARGYLREGIYNEARIRCFMNKNYSPNYILQKLLQEHLEVNADEIQEVFNENEITTEDQIKSLIKKKAQGKTEIDYEEQNKILRYLLSKGHNFDESKKTLKAFATEQHSQEY